MNMTLRDHNRDHDGQFILRVDKVTAEDDELVWSFIIEDGAGRGSKLRYRVDLTPPMWDLRLLLEGLGITVPNGPMDLDLNSLVGMRVGANIKDGADEFWPVEKPVAPVDDKSTTEREVDKAKADLDAALERYVAAKVADSEDIERWQWRTRSKAR
jgi:hypothetical protein